MLKINNITKKYQKNNGVFTALDGLTLHIKKGDFVAIVGPSGSGKSTLLHTVGGLIRPDSGQVLFHGKDIYSLKRHESDLYRRKNVGFVFQQFHLMPYLTVLENIKMVCPAGTETPATERYLEKCGLTPLKNKYPGELSVGEKQRAAFIRAIITKPDILLADEPTGNLDPENSRVIMALTEDFHREGGTVLLVSHNPESSRYATRQITLQTGKLI